MNRCKYRVLWHRIPNAPAPPEGQKQYQCCIEEHSDKTDHVLEVAGTVVTRPVIGRGRPAAPDGPKVLVRASVPPEVDDRLEEGASERGIDKPKLVAAILEEWTEKTETSR